MVRGVQKFGKKRQRSKKAKAEKKWDVDDLGHILNTCDSVIEKFSRDYLESCPWVSASRKRNFVGCQRLGGCSMRRAWNKKKLKSVYHHDIDPKIKKSKKSGNQKQEKKFDPAISDMETWKQMLRRKSAETKPSVMKKNICKSLKKTIRLCPPCHAACHDRGGKKPLDIKVNQIAFWCKVRWRGGRGGDDFEKVKFLFRKNVNLTIPRGSRKLTFDFTE